MPEITLIPKKEKPGFKISFEKTIFYFPITLLTLVVLVFLGFFLYNAMLQKSIESIEGEIKLIESQRDLKEDEKFIDDIFSLNTRIRNLKHILDEHIHSSAVFSFFEKLALPKTRYYGFDVNLVDGIIRSQGEAEGYVAMVKQMIVFSESPEVKEARVSGISLSPGGKVIFSLDLTFDKEILLEKSKTKN
ncbi:MAG: hypothetical protein COT36_00855 [Parcubacteria group bacterium CG08_land_8_20_14_0_20_38_56]|nr:MAG: hypothetical protein COT36_00855 [Parcubacteria group bacterium CG08_land_8_20_14_0_20_38_56]